MVTHDRFKCNQITRSIWSSNVCCSKPIQVKFRRNYSMMQIKSKTTLRVIASNEKENA